MTNALKTKISTAAQTYCAEHKLSQSEFSKKTGVNAAYISQLFKGIYSVGDTEISERWFKLIAGYIGCEIEKTYWRPVATPQFQIVIDGLKTAKENGETRLMIGETGCGKSYGIELFLKKNPQHTYLVTVSNYWKLPDLINELLDMLDINIGPMTRNSPTNSKKARIDQIVKKLRTIQMDGGKPILIIDEGENMELSLLKTLKGLYDQLKDYCAIVVFGTQRLVDKMIEPKKMRTGNGVPELYRRFKAGHITLPAIDVKYKVFLDKMVEDLGLRKLLCDVANNYGELHDYLEPAMREADEIDKPLTEEFFRLKYNMPKFR